MLHIVVYEIIALAMHDTHNTTAFATMSYYRSNA